jgi:hypothetical protein
MRKFKICLVIIAVISVMLMSAFTVGAEESIPESTDESTVENTTVFGRIYEFFENNSTTLFSAGSLILAGVVTFLLKKTGGVIISGIMKTLSEQKNVVTASENNEKATAQMLEKQENVGTRLEELEKSEAERDKMIKALLYEVMTMIQMNHTLALNNANMPQSIKNFTTSLCAKCYSALENDVELRKAYDEMRAVLGISKKDGTKDEKENT